MKLLYITNIQSSDVGTYRCQASLYDFHLEREIQLKVSCKYSYHYLLQFDNEKCREDWYLPQL